MQFAVSGQALAETHSLEQICVAAQQRGIRAIELWPLNAPAASPARQQVTRYEGRDFEHVRRVLGDHGMRLACITLDGAFNAEMMADLADYGAALKYTVEMAGELGSPLVNHYCYQLALEAAPDFAKLRDVWGPAIEAADATGVTLVLENEAHDATRTPEGMLAILEAIDHPRFATNYDACNYFHAGVEGFPHSYEITRAPRSAEVSPATKSTTRRSPMAP
jgi:sugar phosphate isomerase/epimerase